MMVLILATFGTEAAFCTARDDAVAAGHRLVGAWLPYAAETLGSGDGEHGIRGAAITTGLLGAAALFALTLWSMAVAYPFDSGGRPLLSWPAFFPAPVEFGALCAAIGGLLLFFRNARLTRLHDAAFDFPEVERASQDSFVLALACDAGEEANALLAMLAEAGASHSRLVSP